ncbi:hypothetical protein B7463_g546, partial [Scytalidium lignicola]
MEILLGKQVLDIIKDPTKDLLIDYFNDIVEIMGERGDWKNILHLLDKVDGKQLTNSCSTKTHKFIQRATGQGKRLAHLDNLYNNAIIALESGHNRHLLTIMRVWLAVYQRFFMNDKNKAKTLLREALNPANGGSIKDITLASWQFVDILLEQFHQGNLPRQEAARNDMWWLVYFVEELQGPEFQLELSQMSIPLAILQKRMGPATTFNETMEATFQACLRALRDDLASNDAQVACSCQFYIVNKALAKREEENQEGGEWEKEETPLPKKKIEETNRLIYQEGKSTGGKYGKK